jgi:starch synthase
MSCIRAAVGTYRKKELWHKFMENALVCDYSWRRPAIEYEKLYHKVLGEESVNLKLQAD